MKNHFKWWYNIYVILYQYYWYFICMYNFLCNFPWSNNKLIWFCVFDFEAYLHNPDIQTRGNWIFLSYPFYFIFLYIYIYFFFHYWSAFEASFHIDKIFRMEKIVITTFQSFFFSFLISHLLKEAFPHYVFFF